MNVSPDSSARAAAQPTRLTDSAAFWLVLFLNAALLGLGVIAPKYGRREALLERRYETRREIARQKAAGETSPEQPAEQPTVPGDPRAQDRPLLVPLGPLLALLVTLDVVAITFFVWQRRGGGARLALAADPPDSQTAGQPAASYPSASTPAEANLAPADSEPLP